MYRFTILVHVVFEVNINPNSLRDAQAVWSTVSVFIQLSGKVWLSVKGTTTFIASCRKLL